MTRSYLCVNDLKQGMIYLRQSVFHWLLSSHSQPVTLLQTFLVGLHSSDLCCAALSLSLTLTLSLSLCVCVSLSLYASTESQRPLLFSFESAGFNH